jgi:hypothetical protein
MALVSTPVSAQHKQKERIRVKATATSPHSVTLTWGASTTPGVNYHLFRNGLTVASPLTPGYMDTGLDAATAYAYYVTAFYNPCPANVNVPGCADSDPSNTVSVTTPPDVNPVVSVAILPPSANVALGKQQQFTASVTGNVNTAVTWSTTGGSVTQAGLFTAVSAGVSTVKATSVADPTKSASASVTAKFRQQRASDALAKAGAAIEDADHMRPSRFRLCARVGSATKPRKRKVRVRAVAKA